MRRLAVLGGLALLLCVPVDAHAEGASARLSFDQVNQSLNGGDGYKTATNETGTLGWGESYVMMSYAAMFRASGDPTYLVTLADHATSVMKSTDKARGVKDYAGRSRECWQATKYSPNGEPYCWAVHSGMLLTPMAELVLLVHEHPEYAWLPVPGQGTLGDVADALLPQIEAGAAVFEPDWRDGPASGEGHYIAESGASFLSFAGQALPLNMMDALGRTELVLWQVTQNPAYQQRAEALGHYFKNRLSTNGTAYAWNYWGTAWSGSGGEDISHASINVDFAARLHEAGLVFADADMTRFASTLFDKVHIDSVTTADLVDGTGGTNTYSPIAALWLGLCPYDARVWPVGADLYTGSTSGGGSTLLALAMIAEYAPPLFDYSFYMVDWSDQGSYKKATAYGANVLIDPADTSAPAVMKLGCRAWKRTTVQQYDGAKYHDVARIAAHSTGMTDAFVPFVPGLYFGYSGTKALYQFTDSFVASEGIEVDKPAAVAAPTITTAALPAANAGQSYSTKLTATGDSPSMWRLEKPPAGMLVDATTGELTWRPSASDAPSAAVTVRVDNDTGHDEKTFTVSVTGGGADADASGSGGSGGADAGDSGGAGGAPVGTGGVSRGSASPGTGGGCGCDLPRREAPLVPALLLAGLGAIGLRRRRR